MNRSDLSFLRTPLVTFCTGAMLLSCDTQSASQPTPSTPALTAPSTTPTTGTMVETTPPGGNAATRTATPGTPAGAGAGAGADTDDDAAYRRDIERICFAESRSGALDEVGSARMYKVADWLGRNIESERGRGFLVEFSRAQVWEKPDLLVRVSSEVGLDGCPLAETWSRVNTSQ